jgi:hypothetical protein
MLIQFSVFYILSLRLIPGWRDLGLHILCSLLRVNDALHKTEISSGCKESFEAGF